MKKKRIKLIEQLLNSFIIEYGIAMPINQVNIVENGNILTVTKQSIKEVYYARI